MCVYVNMPDYVRGNNNEHFIKRRRAESIQTFVNVKSRVRVCVCGQLWLG